MQCTGDRSDTTFAEVTPSQPKAGYSTTTLGPLLSTLMVQASGNSESNGRVEAGAALLEEGTKQLPTAAMWQVYGQHLHAALASAQVALAQ